MKGTFIQKINEIARSLPFKAPSIPVGHPVIGKIGLCEPQKGFILKGLSSRALNALLKDEENFIKKFNRMSWWKKILVLYPELGQITTWDSVLSHRAAGRADDRFYYKASQTTVANQWSSFFRSGGVPAAGTYANIPGGSAFNVNSTGAFLLTNPASGHKKYLLNFGAQHLTGTNIVALIDLLVAAGNINANATGAQTVNTTALTRYTDGAGVYMILEVTTGLGATASNVTVSYTNQAGTSGRSTGAQAMTASAVAFRLQPVAGGMIMPMASGDIGVRSVQTVEFSAAMGAGVVAILLYRPLLLMPTLSNTTYVERSTPNMLGGITELVTDTGGNLGCLTVFVLTSTTSTGVQTYFLQTVSG